MLLKTQKKIQKIFPFIFLFSLLCCSSTKEQKKEETSSKSSSTRTLHLYTAFDSFEAASYIEAFEKETGIDVIWVRLSSGELLTRLRNEKNRPQVSLWLGGPFTDFILAKKEKLLTPYQPHRNYTPPPESYDPDFFWTGISLGAIGFLSNKEILKRRHLKPPRSWHDLLQPEFQGEITMAYPYTSGTAYTVLASLIEAFGKEKALQFFKQLDRQIHHYNKSGAACVTQVSLGEAGICITFSQDALKKGVSKKFPVLLTFPEEGTGYEFAGAGIIKGAPEPELAQKFMDFIVSEKAQKQMLDFFRTPVHPHIPLPENFPSIKHIRLFPFNPVLAASKKREWIELWRSVTRT